MVTVLSFRLQQCLGPLTMLPDIGSAETGLFRDISNIVTPSLEGYCDTITRRVSKEG